jgi:hypothetical protein
MEYLESTYERDASVTAEFVEDEVLEKVSFTMSKKNPALRVTKVIADNYSLHRNLRLDFIIGKPMCSAARTNIVVVDMSTITVVC